MTLVRGAAVWFALLVVAVVNGGIRTEWLAPGLGERAGHVISSVMLSAAIVLAAWLSMSWIAPADRADAWRVGGMWLAMTMAFEFLAGHFAFGKSWGELLADYDVSRGRIWVVVLVATLIAPVVTRRGQ